LAALFAIGGQPRYIRSDNGLEFACQAVRKWLKKAGVGTLFIESGSPWEKPNTTIQEEDESRQKESTGDPSKAKPSSQQNSDATNSHHAICVVGQTGL